VGMVLLTFAVVDNLFLGIVSQQIDKITAFRDQTAYTSMRDFINVGLLEGALIALPFVALVGSFLGAVASLVRRRLTPETPDALPTASPAGRPRGGVARWPAMLLDIAADTAEDRGSASADRFGRAAAFQDRSLTVADVHPLQL